MTVIYPVIFTETYDNILIEIPDLGILSEANSADEEKGTLLDAICMAKDALALMCIQYQDEGKELPTPTEVISIDAKKGRFGDAGDAVKSFVSIVDVDLTDYRKKISSQLPTTYGMNSVEVGA